MSMPKPENETKELTLTLVWPDRASETVRCDGVRIPVKETAKGKKGGWYGIRPGHAPALFLLAPGTVEAYRGGEKNYERQTSGGFVRVGADRTTITVVTEPLPAPSADICEEEKE